MHTRISLHEDKCGHSMKLTIKLLLLPYCMALYFDVTHTSSGYVAEVISTFFMWKSVVF
jgi:hypothetical protein